MNKKHTLAVASTSVLAAGMAQGAIVHTGPLNYEITTSASFTIDLDQDSNHDYSIRFDNSNQLKPFVDCRASANLNPNAWVFSKTNGGAPITAFGTPIDAGYAANFPTNKVACLFQQNEGGTEVGDWPSTSETDAYIGVALINGATTNYGWIHLIYHATPLNGKTMTLVDFAYETDPNKGIVAGATVPPAEPVIYTTPQSQTVGGGSPVQMHVLALADPAPMYQWRAGVIGSSTYTDLTDNGHYSGVMTPTLSIDAATTNDMLDYVVVVTNSLGSAISSPPATLTVLQAILDGPIPSHEEVFLGQTGRFDINVVSGVPQSYQWRKGGVNLSDGSKYSGTGLSSLLIKNLVMDDAGNYDVVVTTTAGPVTSEAASLTVLSTNGGMFEGSVLANGPASFYRLNETTFPTAGDAVAFDNASGRNGVYGMNVWNQSFGIVGPRPSDGFPGFGSDNSSAMMFANDTNATIRLTPWNLNTNTVTIAAWINPQGPQVNGAAVVYTRSTNFMVCGLAYHGGANANGEFSIGYNWNDQMFAWNWTSGLIVPQNEWSFVTLVVTPTNATVYLMNSNVVLSAVNTATHAVQAFNDTIYIGTDPAGANGQRNFNGMIDEVAVFNRSLSRAEVEAMYFRARGITAIAPKITKDPLPQILFSGRTAHLTVEASGTEPLSYLWKAGTSGAYTNLTDSGRISGSTGRSLTIGNVSAGDVGGYFAVVTNAAGAATSSVVQLSLVVPSGVAYESALLSVGGLSAHYSLNDLGDPAVNAIAFDYVGGFNGVYGTSVQNGNAAYGVTGPRPVDGFAGFGETNSAARITPAPGTAAQITCPPLNLNTNTVTISAWINPSVEQKQWASIVMCRGTGGMVTGLGFNQTNNAGTGYCLGYHWNDAYDTFSWNSGLALPLNQWSFVALVIDPATTNATIWRMNANGIASASHITTNNLGTQSFNVSTLIGNDPLDVNGARAFEGVIDEVAIFGRALSQAELEQVYGAAFGQVPDVTLEVQRVGNQLELQWANGVLLEASALSGPWQTNTATSPYLVTPAGLQKFYRVIVR